MGYLLIAYCIAPLNHVSLWMTHGTADSWRMAEALSYRRRDGGMNLSHSWSWNFGMEDARA